MRINIKRIKEYLRFNYSTEIILLNKKYNFNSDTDYVL